MVSLRIERTGVVQAMTNLASSDVVEFMPLLPQSDPQVVVLNPPVLTPSTQLSLRQRATVYNRIDVREVELGNVSQGKAWRRVGAMDVRRYIAEIPTCGADHIIFLSKRHLRR